MQSMTSIVHLPSNDFYYLFFVSAKYIRSFCTCVWQVPQVLWLQWLLFVSVASASDCNDYQRKCHKLWWLQWLPNASVTNSDDCDDCPTQVQEVLMIAMIAQRKCKVWATNSNEKACEKHQWTVRKKVLWDYFWSKKKRTYYFARVFFFHLEVKTQKKKWLNFGLFLDNSGFEKD